ncbi:ATP-binding protein [Luteimicrobium subarcticum]|uniref:Dynein-related subfamily AAA family protein n=1 Tax=Luteimicrobium subarcticum TaxID=620910 RepID=A0A2M8WRF0_9MICO|nr:AAA family ATPase [Luteimicrobium subarcticum]PJI93511.1 dynein-related subfamily AAA family protein [Luteimicrobium subarcticum]
MSTPTAPHGGPSAVLRAPAETTYAAELERLAAADTGPRPDGWRLTPRAVRAFVVGDERLGVSRKFFGDDALVERCVVTLMSNRGLLLVGEPGTAKSMLSELFAAAVSGDSTCTVQGSSGTTTDQITYSWNYALLLSEGPSPRALVRAPLHRALTSGGLCRFEEVTRVQPEIQDVLIGVMSDKVLHVPELDGDDAVVFATPGFNVVATANLRDRGVHEMSSALKRRFSFETVRPIRDRALEQRLVTEQTSALLERAGVPARLEPDVVDLLVTAFHDLRDGVTADGVVVEKPSAVMSSAEAVAVGYAAALDAHWFDDASADGRHVARQLVGTVLKDDPDDGAKLRHYFDVVVRDRARRDAGWRAALDARGELDR